MTNHITDQRAIHLLISNVLLKSSKIIIHIFLNVYIWKETADIQVIALFNIIYLSFHMISFVGFGPIVKRGSNRILNTVSLAGLAGVFIWAIILGENVINYIYPIAAIFGLFNGIYRINYHLLEFQVTHFKNRGNYNGIKSSLNQLTKIITPSIIGFFISLNYMGYGYQTAYGIGIVLLFGAIYFGNIITNNEKDTQWRFKELNKKAFLDKDIFRSLYTYSLTGFSFGFSLLEIILGLIIFNYVQSEASLGYITSALSIVTIVGVYIFGKFLHYSHYRFAIIIIGGLYALVLLGFITVSSLYLIIIFSGLIRLFQAFYNIPQKVISDNVLHKIENYKIFRVEYMVIREVFLYIGWIISFIILYFIDSIEQQQLLYLFGLIIIFTIIATILLSTINLHKLEQHK